MRDDTSGTGSNGAGPKNGSVPDHSLADDMNTDRLAELLVDSFPPVDPDPIVWDRIEAQIAAGELSPSVDESVPSLDQRRASDSARSSRWAPLMAVAAVFVLVAASAFALAQRSDDVAVVAAGETVRELVDPASGAVAMRVISQEDGSSVAVNDGLPTLADDQTYQLWSVVGDEIVSVGLLGSAPGDVALRVEGSPAVLALTVEVAGGVAVSSADPVAVWSAGA